MQKTALLKGALVLCAFILVWLAIALVRAENQRYALLLGMCTQEAPIRMVDFDCLDRVQTRTGWWWHLFYALKG